MAQCSSYCNRIFYILLVLWVASCFHITEQIDQNQIPHVSSVRQVAPPEQELLSTTAGLLCKVDMIFNGAYDYSSKECIKFHFKILRDS